MKFNSLLSPFKSLWSRIYYGRNLEGVDFIIPYDIDPSLTSGSHKNYSGLFFPSTPCEGDVYRLYNYTLRDKEDRYIQFIDSLFHQATLYNKYRFLYWVREQMQLKEKDFKSWKWRWVFNDKDRSRVSSILNHVNLRIQANVGNEMLFNIPYPWSKEKGAVQNLVEIGLQIIKCKNLKNDVKSGEEFVLWLGKLFGVDLSGSYNTTCSRIKDFDLEEFQAYKFAVKMTNNRGTQEGLGQGANDKRKKGKNFTS